MCCSRSVWKSSSGLFRGQFALSWSQVGKPRGPPLLSKILARVAGKMESAQQLRGRGAQPPRFHGPTTRLVSAWRHFFPRFAYVASGRKNLPGTPKARFRFGTSPIEGRAPQRFLLPEFARRMVRQNCSRRNFAVQIIFIEFESGPPQVEIPVVQIISVFRLQRWNFPWLFPFPPVFVAVTHAATHRC